MKTLKQIAPNWWQSLEKEHVVEPFLDIRMCRACIVGEAHGLKTPYDCVKCASIADEYEQAIEQHRDKKIGMWEEGHLAYDLQLVNEITSRFERHWNEEHECTC